MCRRLSALALLAAIVLSFLPPVYARPAPAAPAVPLPRALAAWRLAKALEPIRPLTAITEAPAALPPLQQPGNPNTTVPCPVTGAVIVTSSPASIANGASVEIRGCNFGASTGTLRLCNASTYAGSSTCEVQSTSAWTNTSITASSISIGALGATAYWYVQASTGPMNTTAPFSVTLTGGGSLTCDETAANLTDTTVQTFLTNATTAGTAGDPYVYCLPAGTAAWDQQVNWTMPAYSVLLGAGSLSTMGGGDVTVIQDAEPDNNSLLAISLPANPATARIAGFTFEDTGSSGVKDFGLLFLQGPNSNLRIDHMHFDTKWIMWFMNGTTYGVADHVIFDLVEFRGIYFHNGSGSDGHGNEVWTEPTAFGGSTWFYIEDSRFIAGPGTSSRIGDSFSGSKVALRMNTMQGVGGLEQHATGQQNGPRGPRAHQSYLNHFSPTEGNEPSQVMVDADNGGLITWGNVVEDDTLKSGVGLFVPRRCGTAGNCAGSAVDAGPPPGGWGYNGPVPLRTGVVDVSGTTVTHVSGDLFSTDWPAGSMIHISGATCSGSTSGTGCVISSVNSATSITLSTSSGAVNDGTYTTGSAWDGNTTATGYPALDQPGRGPGDLLSGDDFPDKVNTETDSVSWPNQVLEPIHVVMTTFTPAAGFGGALLGDSTAGRLTINVDYFTQTDGTQTAQVSNSSPFNGDGTPGVGWGTIANRPACSSGCVLGSVYLATDEGSWNTSTSNPEGVQRNGADGKFYVLTADGVWTARYGGGADNTTGEPYQYPHPLNVN